MLFVSRGVISDQMAVCRIFKLRLEVVSYVICVYNVGFFISLLHVLLEYETESEGWITYIKDARIKKNLNQYIAYILVISPNYI